MNCRHLKCLSKHCDMFKFLSNIENEFMLFTVVKYECVPDILAVQLVSCECIESLLFIFGFVTF